MVDITKHIGNFSIRSKLFAGYVSAFILFLAISGLIVYPVLQDTLEANIESELNNTTKTILNMVKAAADASIKNYLRAVAEKNKEIVEKTYELYQHGLLSEKDAKERAISVLLSQSIGETGYIYCLDSNGVIKVHPVAPLLGADLSKYNFIQEQLKNKEGYIEYDWKNPGELEEKSKALYMTYFKPWDWIISASSYRQEFSQLVNIDNFRDSILSIKFGKTGYSYILDSMGNIIAHPVLTGNVYDAIDSKGNLFVKEMIDKKNGKIIYTWRNPDEEEYREKLVIFNYIPEFDWIVASSSYVDEVYEPLKFIRRGITTIFIVLLFCLFALTFFYSSYIVKHLNKLIRSFQAGSTGDYSTRLSKTSEDELGRLTGYFNDFMEKLDENQRSLQQEIQVRIQAEEALHAREEESRTLVEHSPDTIARYDRQCRRRYVNPRLVAEAGIPREALLDTTPAEFPGGESARRYQQRIEEVLRTGKEGEFELEWAPLGQRCCTHIRLSPEHDRSGEVVSVLAVGRDITEIDDYRRQIHNLAFYDPMTHLPNRVLFNERFGQVLVDADWHGQVVGLMLLDLDRFKTVNDSLGHGAGDALLKETARRLLVSVRGYDTVARLGGDEFAILLPEIRSEDDLGAIAGKILAALAKPVTLEGRELFVTASLGIATFPHDGREPDELFKYADSALYHAKASGRNNFQFYAAELTAQAQERIRLESYLRRAAEKDELELYYQPQLDLTSGLILSAEALIRWRHPELGLVMPDRFIGIAEDTGLIVELGAWVIRQGCQAAVAWNRGRATPFRVSVNVSTRQFQGHDLAETVRSLLAETGCRPEWLELELTESLLLADSPEVRTTLASLHAQGIRLAIDDFGTGYSALAHLGHFPIDTLKIDRGFIRHIVDDAASANLVRAIIALAGSLGLALVAEGVETAEQEALLRQWGCPVAQGYLYSRPLPQAEFEALPRLRLPS